MRILFTDGIGAAVLHNGKVAPANRATGWKPNAMPVGDSANRQSDGALTMIRYRDDFGATFSLTGIPVKAAKTNLIEVNGDITGTLGALPTGFGGLVAPNTMLGVLSGAPNGRPGDVGYNGIMGQSTRDTGAGDNALGYYPVALTNTHHMTGGVWVYIPSTSTFSAVFLQWENNIGSLVGGFADLTKRDQWQQLITTATATASATSNLVLRVNGAVTGSTLYSDAWSVTDADDGLTTRMVDIADRLAYWLANGGTCEVDTGDYDGNIYTTCGLAPGTTAQPPTLSDKQNLEYTLSLALVNLAGSPARMRCHYA